MHIFDYLKKHPVLKGTLLLTAAGLLSRVMGFFYRIFLSRAIGAEGMGIYQLIFPIFGLLISLCASGIQTAISRLVAARSSESEARSVFYCGLILSFSLSFIAACILHQMALPIAIRFLSEERCAPLLRILAPALPLSGIHACINGYYYGLQKAAVPAVTQLAEQGSRMFFIWIAVQIFTQNGTKIPLSVTVWAIVVGELFSSLFSITAFSLRRNTSDKHSLSICRQSFSALLPLAIPLTANRLLISLLSSMESVLIPSRLQIFGHSAHTALSLYGVLTGMAMPLVLFPTAITGSVSVLLLPSVAHAQANKNRQQITASVYSAIKYCLILGILFGGIFLLYGNEIGIVLYHNIMAGDFLVTLAWICPFLYLSSTLASILNGLGKTTLVFFQNTFCLLVRILFVVLLIPRHGILAYLWGLLASLLLQTFIELMVLRSYMKAPFHAVQWILTPCISLLIAVGCSYMLEPVFCILPSEEALWNLGIRLSAVSGFYLLFLVLYSIIPGRFFSYLLKKSKRTA